MDAIFGSLRSLVVIIILLLLCHHTVAQWRITYTPLADPITMEDTVDVNFTVTGK